MSIKNAADLVRAQGRYGDTQLMHVSPKEVEALQGIAQAHGKSLSVNPQTGLPEAFDLGAILPTVAGTAIGSMVGMPWLGAAVGGLGTYATTGSLEKGLMAGLGAFGGASFMGSLGAAGAAGAGTGTTLSASGAVPAAAAQTAIGPEAAAMIEAGQLGPIGGAFEAVNLSGGAPAAIANYGQTAFNALPFADKASAIGTGIQQLATNPADTWAAMGGLKGQGMNLGMMAAPLLSGTFSSNDISGSPDTESNIRQFDWDPVSNSFTRRPVVSAKNYAGRMPSVYGYAGGGQIEEGQMESIKNQIARIYREYLKREPDQAGVDYWANLAASGTPMDQILQGIKSSQEAGGLRAARSVEDFYRDYLGRTPEAEGREFWTQALQSGVSPEQVQRDIMQSQEAADIRAAAQQRQQAFSPLPPTGPMVGATPVQQAGIGMIPNRYQAPVNIPSQGVQDYNQLLANRAAYEYTQMPMPDAMRPRTPAEMERIRDRQLLGQQMRMQGVLAGRNAAPQANDMQSQIDAAVNSALAGRGMGGYGYGYSYGDGGGDTSGNSMGDAGGAVAGGAAGTGTDGEDGWKRGGATKKYAAGGIASIPSFQAGGEMESDAFVVPADVVSALGNGSTAAGVDILNEYLGMAMPIEGDGDGLSDDIPATIDGEQPARVADGEVYIPAEVVAMLGQGNPDKGAAKLYAMLDKIREAAHGKTKQQGEVNPEEVMPE